MSLGVEGREEKRAKRARDEKSYRSELVRLTKERADRLAISNDILRGKLVYKADVEEVIGTVVTTIRAQLLSLPAALADELAKTDTPQQASKVLARAIDDTLLELSALGKSAEKRRGGDGVRD